MRTDPASDWLASLKQQALARAPLLVAFSGGLDSTVLLHTLASDARIRECGLRAIHVDHGLNTQSHAWAEHCQRICAQWELECLIQRVTVTPGGLGPEGAARAARYGAFESALRSDETLALGHHQDDQAETVLLRLLRGAGSAGLAGMPSERALAQSQLWRPLLQHSRATLVDYAQAHGLTWLDDPSNADTGFDRNFLRHQLMPLLRQRWPHAAQALTHSARWLAEDAQLLDQACAEHLATAQGLDPDTLSIAALQALPEGWPARVLRHWLRERALPPLPAGALDTVSGAWLQARVDAVPELRWSGAIVRRWRGMLWAERAPAPWPRAWQCEVVGQQPARLPDGRMFQVHSSEPISEHFSVRGRRGGERMQLPGRSHRSELKTLLHALELPPWHRTRVPLLFDAEGRLLAAGEYLTSHEMIERGWQWRACRELSVAAH